MKKQTFFTTGLLILGIELLSKGAFAQDPNFSQFFNQPIQNNPAFAGINDGLRFSALYRNQWTRVPGKFNTFDCAVDMETLNYGGGLGLVASSDVEGEGFLTTQTIGGIYSYRITVIPKNLIFQAGFQTSYISQKIDFSRLVFSDQLDSRYGFVHPQSTGAVPNAESKSMIDFSVGSVMVMNLPVQANMSKKRKATVNWGVAFHHITRPDQSLMGLNARLPIKFSTQLTTLIPFNFSRYENLSGLIVPAVLYERQDKFRELVMGVNCLKNPLFGGLFFRSRSFPGLSKDVDALIADIGVDLKINRTTNLKVCYSYDVSINGLRGYSPGAHEIGLFFWFKNASHGRGGPSNKKMDCFYF